MNQKSSSRRSKLGEMILKEFLRPSETSVAQFSKESGIELERAEKLLRDEIDWTDNDLRRLHRIYSGTDDFWFALRDGFKYEPDYSATKKVYTTRDLEDLIASKFLYLNAIQKLSASERDILISSMKEISRNALFLNLKALESRREASFIISMLRAVNESCTLCSNFSGETIYKKKKRASEETRRTIVEILRAHSRDRYLSVEEAIDLVEHYDLVGNQVFQHI